MHGLVSLKPFVAMRPAPCITKGTLKHEACRRRCDDVDRRWSGPCCCVVMVPTFASADFGWTLRTSWSYRNKEKATAVATGRKQLQKSGLERPSWWPIGRQKAVAEEWTGPVWAPGCHFENPPAAKKWPQRSPNAQFGWSMATSRGHNSTEDLPREREQIAKMEREGKNAKFWPLHPSGRPPFGPRAPTLRATQHIIEDSEQKLAVLHLTFHFCERLVNGQDRFARPPSCCQISCVRPSASAHKQYDGQRAGRQFAHPGNFLWSFDNIIARNTWSQAPNTDHGQNCRCLVCVGHRPDCNGQRSPLLCANFGTANVVHLLAELGPTSWQAIGEKLSLWQNLFFTANSPVPLVQSCHQCRHE